MLITDFIFDLGNVLVDYNPMRCILGYTHNVIDANYIASEVFASEQWIMLDKGVITYEEALSIWKERIPERLHLQLDEIIANFHKHLPAIPEMTELVKRLKESGKRIFILSNVSERFPKITEGLEVMKYVDGVLLSHEVKTLKPDPQIYASLLRKYSINPQGAIFIDDCSENVHIATKFGMAGYIFDGDVEKITESFDSFGFFRTTVPIEDDVINREELK
jgi:putative hydrolase of the HAD superfamily